MMVSVASWISVPPSGVHVCQIFSPNVFSPVVYCRFSRRLVNVSQPVIYFRLSVQVFSPVMYCIFSRRLCIAGFLADCLMFSSWLYIAGFLSSFISGYVLQVFSLVMYCRFSRRLSDCSSHINQW